MKNKQLACLGQIWLYFHMIRTRKHSSRLNPDARGRLAYRLSEVSDMIGIPTSTLRTMVRRGELNPITSFGTWLIYADELEALLKKRLRPTAPDNHHRAKQVAVGPLSDDFVGEEPKS